MGNTQENPLAVLRTAFSRSGYAQAEAFLEQDIHVRTIRSVRASIPIERCAEPLVPIPKTLALCRPHPYVEAGAPYGSASPWRVRASVAERLAQAQVRLDQVRPECRISVFDAFRPLNVQVYMIEHECGRLARESKHQAFDQLDAQSQADIKTQVMQFWAAPDPNPTAPPPHSTGAAVDVTIVDHNGAPLPMGTDIDDLTEKACPSYFADRGGPFHENRTLLNDVMQQSGFHRNPIEWWHFSHGDQAWALIEALESPEDAAHAKYGAVT